MTNKTYNAVMPLKNVLEDDLDQLRISLYHSTGGVNFATYKQEKAGWYLSFSPVHISEETNGFTATRTILFHDRAYKMWCCDGKRFSASKLAKLADVLRNNIAEIVEMYDEKEDQMLYEFIQSRFNGVK